jgi:molybdopterin-containing oxidoreductase family membrane subunit
MKAAVRNYLVFLLRCGRLAFVGDWRYFAWMGVLTVLCLLGLNAYLRQLVHGLQVTGMSDEVSWGVYIANFTFLVGVAAAAVMMVIPVYIYNNEELHDLVILANCSPWPPSLCAWLSLRWTLAVPTVSGI